jgi:hypothetical protein
MADPHFRTRLALLAARAVLLNVIGVRGMLTCTVVQRNVYIGSSCSAGNARPHSLHIAFGVAIDWLQ